MYLHVLQQNVTIILVPGDLSLMCGAYYKQVHSFEARKQGHQQDAFAFQ